MISNVQMNHSQQSVMMEVCWLYPQHLYHQNAPDISNITWFSQRSNTAALALAVEDIDSVSTLVALKLCFR
ncbi:hypothetical protein CS542_09410 [Pedobacter sp. IW39]|nr:hypothetical protein CS542_09410 [Pedobacter sp. IW39]